MASPLGAPASPLLLEGTAPGAAHAASKRVALAAAPRKKVRRERAEGWDGEFVGMVPPVEVIGQSLRTEISGGTKDTHFQFQVRVRI
jgi:hypothetical protein